MKLVILLAASLISFSVVSDELKEGIDINIELLMCLDEKIPNSEIEDPEDRTAKSLLLFPVVINNITKSASSDESQKLFKLAVTYCEKEINSFKIFVGELANNQLKQNKSGDEIQ